MAKNTENEKVVEETAAVETAAVETKPEAVKVDIIRGRMPLPIVAMIKFAPEGETDGALAAKFRTTNGKVSDIRKARNFGYIGSDYVPSADQIAKAVVFAEQLEDKSILNKINSLTPATEEQNAAFELARKSTRKVTPTAAPAPAADEDAAAPENLDGLTE